MFGVLVAIIVQLHHWNLALMDVSSHPRLAQSFSERPLKGILTAGVLFQVCESVGEPGEGGCRSGVSFGGS